MIMKSLGFASLLLGSGVKADLYMHNPRGSNNRCNEQSANRQNGNRAFDSQNNNRGGYNKGDNGVQGFNQPGDNNSNDQYNQMYNPNLGDDKENIHYDMLHLEGSMMRMTWTSQHGCGNSKNNCNMVLQFGCDTDDYREQNTNFDNLKNKGTGTRMNLRSCGNTGTPDAPNNVNNIEQTFNNNNGNSRGRHESEEFYYFATKRQREQGLFTADQNLKGNTQIYTRQNPNGNRRGLEVPEERDYYPWWGVSPWKDIAWLGNDVDYCKTNIAPESQNVKEKWTCTGPNPDDLPTADQIEAQTETACDAAGGTWTGIKWDGPELDCQKAAWSQVNNHGNVDGTARGGQMQNYVWELPTIAQFAQMGCHVYNGPNVPDSQKREIDGTYPQFVRIAIRNRYNMSTMDYDGYDTFADKNENLKEGTISPIEQNPTVDVGAHMQGLRLAINTAQTGRTFQDRSHAITVMEVPDAAPAAMKKGQNILNVNVRGKRGNIVQTYPAVEYDFEPNDIELEIGQVLHFQWTGSNTHNNGNPAGDGQAGDAGEGTGGTDRSNLAELQSLRSSYPVPYDKVGGTFLDQAECYHCYNGERIEPHNAKIWAASAGYYANQEAIEDQDELNVLLNNVGASFQGMCCVVTKAGVHNMVSTRNNNFSNRAQKLHLVVKPENNNVATAEKWSFFPAKEILSDQPSNYVK